MSSLLHRSRRAALLLCLLGGGCLSLPAAEARPYGFDSTDGPGYGVYGPYSSARLSGDRHRDWLEGQRQRSQQAYWQTQRRLDQLERCLERSRQSSERDQCLRRDLEARERQWQREQRDWQQLIRRQGRVAQLAWPSGN